MITDIDVLDKSDTSKAREKTIMHIADEMQAIINQLGPGIHDEKAAGCVSKLLQEAGTEASYTRRQAAPPRLSPNDKCCFAFDDTDYLNQLGPAVDDETMLAYLSHVLA